MGQVRARVSGSGLGRNKALTDRSFAVLIDRSRPHFIDPSEWALVWRSPPARNAPPQRGEEARSLPRPRTGAAASRIADLGLRARAFSAPSRNHSLRLTWRRCRMG